MNGLTTFADTTSIVAGIDGEVRLYTQYESIEDVTLFKNDTNDGYMLCNSNSCFRHEKDFSGVVEVLDKR